MCGKRSCWPLLSLALLFWCSLPLSAEPLSKAQVEAFLMILTELETGLTESRQGLETLNQGLSEIKSGLETSRQGSEKALSESGKALKETESLQVDLIEQKQEVSKLKADSTELRALLKSSADSSRTMLDELNLWKWGTAGAVILAVLIAVFR